MSNSRSLDFRASYTDDPNISLIIPILKRLSVFYAFDFKNFLSYVCNVMSITSFVWFMIER